MQVIKESKPVARKHHQCNLCAGPVLPGEKYLRTTIKDDDIYDWLECSHCLGDNVAAHVIAWSSYRLDYTLDTAQEWATEAVIHGHPREQAVAKNYLERGPR